MNKYSTLRRSQLLVRLIALDGQLLATDGRGRPRIKWGSTKDRELRRERAQVFEALAARDAEILAQWHAAVPCRERRDLR